MDDKILELFQSENDDDVRIAWQIFQKRGELKEDIEQLKEIFYTFSWKPRRAFYIMTEGFRGVECGLSKLEKDGWWKPNPPWNQNWRLIIVTRNSNYRYDKHVKKPTLK